MKELLSPAGDMESLKAAIHGGCNAVYIGGKKFGARKFASNFSNEEIVDAVKYCHLYGVKLYVTVNTIIYESELDEVVFYVRFLHKIGVDALIIQDIGLIRVLRDRFPNLELHASTQLHNYTLENFKVLEDIGVSRVVLAREASINEIKNIKTKLEKEVFIHGAICISYSGQCLFSSLILNRSGNRGECAGMCRLPYKLKINGKVIDTKGEYLLSPKELSTIDKFNELMDSDIKSFKIEGRMKSPIYVYYVTKLYRTLIDNYYNGVDKGITLEEINNLSTIFNREFTNGKLFDSSNDDFMNIISPNHKGIHLGKIIDVDSKYITIKLECDLNQEDGIRFVESDKGMIVNFLYNKKGLLINSAKSGDIVKVDNKFNIRSTGSSVRKTIDKKLNDLLSNYPLRRIDINFKVDAKLGDRLKISISDGVNEIIEYGNVITLANNRPISKMEIEKQLNRLGNTPFKLNDIDIDISDNIFISLSELNNIRRVLTDKLISVRENIKTEFIDKKIGEIKLRENNNKSGITCLVRNIEQLNAVCKYDLKRIYITDKSLYDEYKEKIPNLYLRVERLSDGNNYKDERLLLTELAQFNLITNNKCVTDYYLNVVNSKYLEYLSDKGVISSCISVEARGDDLYNLTKFSRNFDIEVVIYGRLELMIMKHCILGSSVGNKLCSKCNLCDGKCYLIDRNNKEYPIVANHNKINHILNYKSDILSDEEVYNIINDGVDIRIEFFDEGFSRVIEIMEKYTKMLKK